ncbi:hypothetical protein I601_3987 [Nocardioides dokdonensis FR1436]|uniref:Neutral metalloprotease n=1 Tax=Nocardioides dokdonensis FR1436 TaxID=1300347 RepID=A0A1A9GPZ7_9ACTN|nr:MXAN_6640 family putative metalloprotease [Nocardioides dokdonensis]ANH40384.1 hypothetical protein I601_3987 [Nocardioides dokdonensis FR1436]
MRRRTTSLTMLATTLVTVVATAMSTGLAPGATGSGSAAAAASARPLSGAAASTGPDRVLTRARSALGLEGQDPKSRAPGSPVGERRDATLALRDLAVALPQLDAEQRREGESLLARPTDGSSDPIGQGYSSRSKKLCGGNVCVHYVTQGADAPRNKKWVRTTLSVMNKVWKFETGKLGYRTPVSDRSLPKKKNGGNGKFDVYLKELSSQRLYGYCAPEYVVKGNKRLANGYCVLDDDFAKAEYGRKPLDTLRVTAAHEFFHAIQFNYDYREDRWLMESTATWIEERFADDVDDNRQYLKVGQVRGPHKPLDIFDTTYGYHYGNWAWWEFLSQKYGSSIVSKVWKQAGQYRGAGRTYSTKALTRVLKSKRGFTRDYAQFAAVNNNPKQFYSEGKHWPEAVNIGTLALSKSSPSASKSASVDHMSAQNIDITPASEIKGNAWRVRLSLAGPGASSKPMAAVLVQNKQGRWGQKLIRFNRKGKAKVSVPFSARKIDAVTVSFVNASTSFDCNEGRPYSCSGIAKHDDKPFRVVAKAYRR